MKKMSLLLATLLLSACEKPMPFESAEALAENPERLKELRLQCRDNRAKLGEAQCNAVIDAQRIRFMGCLLYTSPSPRDRTRSRMPSSA